MIYCYPGSVKYLIGLMKNKISSFNEKSKLLVVFLSTRTYLMQNNILAPNISLRRVEKLLVIP